MNFLLLNLKERSQKSDIDLRTDDPMNEQNESSIGTQDALDEMRYYTLKT